MTAGADSVACVETEEGGSARARTLRWRDEVVRYLRGHGLTVGRPLLPDGGPWHDRGEVDGVPGWSVLVRRQRHLNLPASMDQAAEHAIHSGNSRAAVVVYRRDRPLDQAYVLLNLGTFSRLLVDELGNHK